MVVRGTAAVLVRTAGTLHGGAATIVEVGAESVGRAGTSGVVAIVGAGTMVSGVIVVVTSGARVVGAGTMVSGAITAVTSGARTGVVIVVAHTVPAVNVNVAVGAAVIVAAAVPTTPAIADVDGRTIEVVVAVAVVVADRVVPAMPSPTNRTEEVVERAVEIILPIEEHVAEIHVAIVPIRAIAIGGGADAHEVFEIDFVSTVVLLRREVEFVGHLVR